MSTFQATTLNEGSKNTLRQYYVAYSTETFERDYGMYKNQMPELFDGGKNREKMLKEREEALAKENADVPKHVKPKITNLFWNNPKAFLTEYLRPYFNTKVWNITINTTTSVMQGASLPYAQITVRKINGYVQETANFALNSFPSCCGWSIFNAFGGVPGGLAEARGNVPKDFMRDQHLAYLDALALFTQWHLAYPNVGPHAMAVFVSMMSGQSLDMKDIKKTPMHYQWALDSLLMVPNHKIELMESRINKNSQRRINTVSIARLEKGDICAAWN